MSTNEYLKIIINEIKSELSNMSDAQVQDLYDWVDDELDERIVSAEEGRNHSIDRNAMAVAMENHNKRKSD